MVDVLDTFRWTLCISAENCIPIYRGPFTSMSLLRILVHNCSFWSALVPAFRRLFEKNSYQITYSSLGIWFAYCDRLGNCGRG